MNVATRLQDAPQCLSCDRSLSAERGYWLYSGRPRCDACAKEELSDIIGSPWRTLKIALAAIVALVGYGGFIAMFMFIAAHRVLAYGLIGLAFSALGVLNRTLDGDAEARALVEVVKNGKRTTLYELHKYRRWTVWLVMLVSVGGGGYLLTTAPKPAALGFPRSSGVTAVPATQTPSKLRKDNFDAAQRKLDGDGEERPACYTGERGQMFVFADDGGKDVVVDSFTRVPPGKRAGARCIVN